jgi:hypothetical protein
MRANVDVDDDDDDDEVDNDSDDDDDDDDDVSSNEVWTMEHSVFEKIVTYSNYGRKVGLSPQDIAALSEEVELQLRAQEL